MRNVIGVLVIGCILAGCYEDEITTSDPQPQPADKTLSIPVSLGEDYTGRSCDALTEGEAFCLDDRTLVYCSLGEWWMVDCIDDLDADFCGEDDYYDTADCYYWL